jgi:hypothetical protein
MGNRAKEPIALVTFRKNSFTRSAHEVGGEIMMHRGVSVKFAMDRFIMDI